MDKVGVVLLLLIALAHSSSIAAFEQIKQLVSQWAPLIWISPEEKYYPSSVDHFFENVHLANENGKAVMSAINGTHFAHFNTKSLYLVTKRSLDNLLYEKTSFLNGHNPNKHQVPIYVIITPCTPNRSFRASDASTVRNDIFNIMYRNSNPKLFFSVSYWVFYPYNRGKDICFIGNVPSLTLFGRCFGRFKTISSHVGDWEHMTLTFKGNSFPSEMYVAIHDTGGYYTFDLNHRHFKLNSHRNSRGLHTPKLPPIVRIQKGHPVLFAATGSHGLWPAPGEHEYVKIPRLTDKCGYGIPWETWKNIKMFSINCSLPKWMFFKGRWGNPKTGCVLSKQLGLCQFTDGPPGILRNKQEFSC